MAKAEATMRGPWNLSPATTLPRLLADNAQALGDAVALREKEYGIWQQVSWSQWLESVLCCAAGLEALGFAAGDALMVVGDNRPNLLKAGAWSLAAGWSNSGGTLTHAPGTAGDVSQAVALQAGRWYRLGLTIDGRTAGAVTPQLTGGSDVSGASYTGNGRRSDRLQAVTGNNRFSLAATAPFDGSVDALALYLETSACLAQGTHYLWLEPQTGDGLAGPASGPFTLEVI